MAKYSDIGTAFTRAVKTDPNRGLIVTTNDFVIELEKLNHHWSRAQANAWIERYQGFFRDYTPHHGDDRSYFMKNMGRIL